MKRRTLLKSLLIGGAGVSVAHASEAGPKKYGLIDVGGHLAHKKATGETLLVYVNGIEVTRGCYEANDLEGYVKLFCRDEADHHKWDAQGAMHIGSNGGACSMVVRGHVVIAPEAK